jgi:hypothetical protein
MGAVPPRTPGRDGTRRGLQPTPPAEPGAAADAWRRSRAADPGRGLALVPGGLLVFSIIHPCFEQLASSWREHGEYHIREYFAEYEIPGSHASSFHRPLSAYLNELMRLGCQLREVDEPALDPAIAAAAGGGAEAYAHLPNFLVVAARRADGLGT